MKINGVKGKLMNRDIKLEAEKIFKEAKLRGIKLKLFGSVGIKFRCHTHRRSTFDIDFVALREDIGKIKALFRDLGYKFSSISKRRTDFVFFKKEPIKVKIDVDVDGLRMFEEGYFIPLREYIMQDEHPSLPSSILLVLKMLAPLDDDTAYDIICLLNEDPPLISAVVDFLNKHPKIREIIKGKISSLISVVQKEPRRTKKEKFKTIGYLKKLKKIL